MLNPFDVPDLGSVRYQFQQQKEAAKAALRYPAIGMIVAASIGLFFGILFLGMEAMVVATGAGDPDESPEYQRIQLVIRSVTALVGMVNCGFSIWAGVQMQRLRYHQLCWIAAITACIPVIGPCFCLGIPTGAWAITVLSRPEVEETFES